MKSEMEKITKMNAAALTAVVENQNKTNESVLGGMKALSDSIDGLRTVSILVATGLAECSSINREKFLLIVDAEIAAQHPENVPISVLDFRAALHTHYQQLDDAR